MRRWQLFAGFSVALFQAMPPEPVVTIAELALLAPLMGALAAALTEPATRFAALLAFAVTASNFALFGIGSAFWGLISGLLVLGLDQLVVQRQSRPLN